MKIAYLDTFSGISGDMTLGAFISAGVSLDALQRELTKIEIGGYEISEQQIVKSGIAAVKVDVIVKEKQRSSWPTPPRTLRAHGGCKAYTASLVVDDVPHRLLLAPCLHLTSPMRATSCTPRTDPHWRPF